MQDYVDSPFLTISKMRLLFLTVMLLPLAACGKPPARIVAGIADTVIVNNRRPVRLPIQVLDARGNVLPGSGVRYEWTSGMPISVSATGVVTCTQPGDAGVRASLGSLTTRVFLRCRPVSDVHAVRMLNLVVGDPPQELPFEAVGVDGQPVTLLTGNVTVEDSSVATVEGLSVRARAGGSTGMTMRVGDRRAFAEVHVYDRATTPERIRPGQHLAMPVRLAGGEMRRWRLAASPETYYVTMLPDRNGQDMPALVIAGASCGPGMDAHSFFCLAGNDASVTAYTPRNIEPSKTLSGTLAVWRQSWQ